MFLCAGNDKSTMVMLVTSITMTTIDIPMVVAMIVTIAMMMIMKVTLVVSAMSMVVAVTTWW